MKNISIKDIALEVGVSTTTVSFVLNGKAKEKRISDDLRDRILETASKLNYRPNQVARGLRTGQTHTLGLMVEDISNPFFAQLARVVEHEADKNGYTVMFCSTDNNDEKAGSLLYMLRHRQMDGFIVVPTPGLKKEIQSLSEEGKAVVQIDRFFPDLDSCYVAVDSFKGALEGTELLIRSGFQKIGLVTVASDQVQMRERENGFKTALQSAGMASGDDLILRIPFDFSTSRIVEAITGFVQKQADLKGIFFTTNYLGVAGVESFRLMQKRIPEDMGMVCFDDSDLFRLASPSISVVAQPIEAIGKKAVEILLDLLTAKVSGGKCQQLIAPVIHERESTRMVRNSR